MNQLLLNTIFVTLLSFVKCDSYIRYNDTIAIAGIVVQNKSGLWSALFRTRMLDPSLSGIWTRFKVTAAAGSSNNGDLLHDGDAVNLTLVSMPAACGVNFTNSSHSIQCALSSFVPGSQGSQKEPMLQLVRILFKHSLPSRSGKMPLSNKSYIKMRAVGSSIDCNGAVVVQCSKKAKNPADYGFILLKVYK